MTFKLDMIDPTSELYRTGGQGPSGAPGIPIVPTNAQLRLNHRLARMRLNFTRSKGWEDRLDLIVAVRDIELEMKRRGMKCCA